MYIAVFQAPDYPSAYGPFDTEEQAKDWLEREVRWLIGEDLDEDLGFSRVMEYYRGEDFSAHVVPLQGTRQPVREEVAGGETHV